ncbi:outer membrane protein assembly factor BamD [Maribacter antarcticus]|uniref:outer membrane protein assembly factor BamD n=1 Tax=Maribacter antarcticus TaxID=505250 RepID=UPI00055E8F93|nr:outer membrane protein assembly factor BamD [Maribacter antarcticus]
MKRFFIFMVLLAAFQSCSEYQKVLKNEDVKPKYDMAEKLYEEGEFKHSNRLLEQIAPKYIGKPQGERVMFFLANSYYEMEDYNTAGYQFERFIKSYPKSDKSTEAAYLGAKSYYQLSPNYSLDQSDTDKALLKLQNFINAFSESEYFAESNAMAQELTTKKERKAYEILKQYNKLGQFNYDMIKSAVAASNNFVSDFPGSIYREEALFVKADALTHMAMNSFRSLQKERLESAKEAIMSFNKQYPNTNFEKEITNLADKVENGLGQYTAESK